MKWFIVTTLILNILLVTLGAGKYLLDLCFYTFMTSLFFGLPLLLLASLLYLFTRKNPQGESRRMACGGIVIVLFIVCSWPAIPISYKILGHRVSQTKAWCESLVPQLDAMYQQRHAYPVNLTDIAPPDNRPISILDFYYDSDGQSFSFTISVPGAMLGGYTYTHTDRQWTNWD